MSAAIRRATPFDTGDIVRLCVEMHGEEHRFFGPITDEKINAGFETIATAIRNGFALVAECGDTGAIVGSIGGLPAQDWWSNTWWLQDRWWYVRPGHRDSGVGTNLMKHFVALGREHKMQTRTFWLGGIERGKALERMMRSIGFEAVGMTFRHTGEE